MNWHCWCWSRQSLSAVSTMKFPSFPHPHTISFWRKEVTVCSPHVGSYVLPPGGRRTYIITLKCSALEICLFSTVYRLTQTFVCIWMDSEYLVYTLSCNPISVCFVAQVIVTLAIGNPFSWLLCPFNMSSNVVIICVFSTSFLWGSSRRPRLMPQLRNHTFSLRSFSSFVGQWC